MDSEMVLDFLNDVRTLLLWTSLQNAATESIYFADKNYNMFCSASLEIPASLIRVGLDIPAATPYDSL